MSGHMSVVKITKYRFIWTISETVSILIFDSIDTPVPAAFLHSPVLQQVDTHTTAVPSHLSIIEYVAWSDLV